MVNGWAWTMAYCPDHEAADVTEAKGFGFAASPTSVSRVLNFSSAGERSAAGGSPAMVVAAFTGPGIGIGFGIGCGFGVGWGFGGMPLNMFGLGIGGGCGVGLGLGWGFGKAYGCQYRSSRVQFQGIEFQKKTEGDEA